MKRYTVKRGKRSALEYDVLVYDGKNLVFRGSFCGPSGKRLTKTQLLVIQAMKDGIESLNHAVDA